MTGWWRQQALLAIRPSPSNLGVYSSSRRRRSSRYRYSHIPAPFSTTSSTSTSKPPRPNPSGTYVWRDLPYYQGPDACEKHQLDIYVADAPFPRPLQPIMIFVHGGFWCRGDRQHPVIKGVYDNVGAACAKAGVVGVIISYRLSPQIQHPHHAHDVARAITWVHQSASRYGGDSSRIFLAGHSAGAHLCAYLLSSSSSFQVDTQSSSSSSSSSSFSSSSIIRGLIGMAGVYNIERLSKSPMATTFLPFVFGAEETSWYLASPTHLLRRHSQQRVLLQQQQQNHHDDGASSRGSSSSNSSHGSTLQQKGAMTLPIESIPTLFINAEADFHLHQDSQEFHELLLQQVHTNREEEKEKKGRRIERSAIVIPKTDHISLVNNMNSAKGQAVDDAVFAFIQRHS